MANFLRKFVHSKSRSKSPVKHPSNVAEHEFEHHWGGRFGGHSKKHPASKQQLFAVQHRHHHPRQRSPKYSAVVSHQTLTPPSHYFTPDYKSPLQSYDEPYQRMESYGEHHPMQSAVHPQSPHSLRSNLPFHSLAIKDNNHGSSSNGMLSPPPSNGGWPPLFTNYGRDSSTEYWNTWNTRTTHSGPGSLSAPASCPTEHPTNQTYLQSNGRLPSPSVTAATRPRSISPKKAVKQVEEEEHRKHRSRSPTKKSSSRSINKTYDYLHAQCKMEGCSAVIVVEDSRFLVCKHQLSHASDFFRTLFLNNRALPIEGVKQTSLNEYTIVVSGLKHPPQTVQFQWFLECTIPCPLLKDITEDALETCMRLCKRFSAKGLEFRCAKYIKDHVAGVQPMMALCWLNWVFKHRFDSPTHEACLPVVARLSLCTLESHRQMMPEKILVDLLAMKLRTCYQQSAKVFHTIHHMDHFFVDMDRCPRCGRQREHGKVRIQANPCHKLIGCDRCLQDVGCEIERKSQGEYQAFHQCEHGLWAFNSKTEDCHCQTPMHKANYLLAHTAQVVESSASDATIRTTPSTTVPAVNVPLYRSSSQSIDKNVNS